MSRTPFISVISILLFPQLAIADQIVLKNGDRITGAIVKSDGQTLTLKSEFAGTLSIPMNAIVRISSDQQLHVVTKEGKTVVGSLSADAEKVEITGTDKEPLALARDSVVALRSNDEQAAWERMQHPPLWRLWTGAVDASLSLIQGNAETSSFSLAMNMARTTTRDKISLYATSLYARDSTTGTSLVSANAKRGGGRYDFNINSRSFAFAFGDLEADDFQKLDLRVNPGGGFGWHAAKAERLTLDFFGGGSINREYFSTGLRRTSGDLVVGNDLTFKLGGRTSFKEKTVYFPNMSELGEYRIAFDASLATALSKWLSWQFSLSDRYLSNPVFGTKANDIILSTGLRLTFAR
jgi:putative salt-induced outer membrane protein YdiY